VERVGLTSLSLIVLVFPPILFVENLLHCVHWLLNVYTHVLKATSFCTQTESNVFFAHYRGDGISLIDTGF